MKKFILSGDRSEVEKVIRENRLRISRGVISITPAESEAALNNMGKETIRELAALTGDVVAILVEQGCSLPDEIVERLAKFRVPMPEREESDLLNPSDNKHIEVEDMLEVDFDADGKTMTGCDAKEVVEEDIKKAAPPKRFSKRTRKGV